MDCNLRKKHREEKTEKKREWRYQESESNPKVHKTEGKKLRWWWWWSQRESTVDDNDNVFHDITVIIFWISFLCWCPSVFFVFLFFLFPFSFCRNWKDWDVQTSLFLLCLSADMITSVFMEGQSVLSCFPFTIFFMVFFISVSRIFLDSVHMTSWLPVSFLLCCWLWMLLITFFSLLLRFLLSCPFIPSSLFSCLIPHSLSWFFFLPLFLSLWSSLLSVMRSICLSFLTVFLILSRVKRTEENECCSSSTGTRKVRTTRKEWGRWRASSFKVIQVSYPLAHF